MTFNSKKGGKKIPPKIYPVGFYNEILECYDYETRNPTIYGMLFAAKWNLPKAAKNAGLTNKEMKITFNEYCTFHPPTWEG